MTLRQPRSGARPAWHDASADPESDRRNAELLGQVAAKFDKLMKTQSGRRSVDRDGQPMEFVQIMNSVVMIPPSESDETPRENLLWGVARTADGQVQYALKHTRYIAGKWEQFDATLSKRLDDIVGVDARFAEDRLAAGWQPGIPMREVDTAAVFRGYVAEQLGELA